MGESRRKKERRPSVKPTDKLPLIPTTTDRVIASRQRSFCRTLITKLLDDESSLSFSKPVLELWDKSVLGDYFDKIKKPMDLGTVRKRLSTAYNQPGTELFDPNAFREDVRLVFLNALEFNAKGTDLARFATRFINFIDNEMLSLPTPTSSDPPAHSDSAAASAADKSSDSPPKHASSSLHPPADKHADAGRDKDDGDGDSDGDGDGDGDGDDLDDDLDGATGLGGDKPGNPTTGRKGTKTSRTGPGSGGDGAGDDDDDGDDDDLDGARGKAGGDGDQDSSKRDTEETNGGSGGPDTGNGGGADDDDDDTREPAERDRLLQRIATLNKQRDAQLAELELEQSSPLSYDEISALRDEVERLPWDMSQKVVDILRNYVDDALKECGEADPEFVTLEFSAVETKLLRKIESFVKPNQKLQAERESLAKAEHEIEAARKRLKRLSDGHGGAKRKRSKKTR